MMPPGFGRALALIAAGTVLLVLSLSALLDSRPLPACEEDQVLIGRGEFERGRWTGYRCGPALDDIRLLDP